MTTAAAILLGIATFFIVADRRLVRRMRLPRWYSDDVVTCLVAPIIVIALVLGVLLASRDLADAGWADILTYAGPVLIGAVLAGVALARLLIVAPRRDASRRWIPRTPAAAAGPAPSRAKPRQADLERDETAT